MKRIIAHCDPHNARRHYNGQEIVKRDGNTPVEWVMGHYDTDDAAKSALWDFAMQDYIEHYANLVHEDNESIADMKRTLADDTGLSPAEIDAVFSWYEGEGVYTRDGHEAVLLKGGTAYSYDTMTYYIDEL